MNRPSAGAVPARLSIRRAVCALAAVLAAFSAGRGTARAETLTLADCLRETAAHNPDILAQQAAIQQATAERLVLRARALPRLTLGGILGYLGARTNETLRLPVTDPVTGKRSNENVNTARNATEIVLGTGELDQPLFDAAIPASWRRGSVGITVAQENFYAVSSTQLEQTRIFFYTALFQQEYGAALRAIDESLAKEVKSFDQLVTAGLTGRQGLLASQVQRTNFDTALLANTGSLQTGLNNLLQNMGRELGPAGSPGTAPTANIRLAGPLEDRAISFDPASATRESLANRPDLRTLRATLRSVSEDANIARAGYYPSLRVYVAGELVPTSFVQRTGNNSSRASDQTQTTEIRPGVSGNWTVIDTGAVRGTVQTIDAQRDTVAVALQQAEKNLGSDLALVRARMVDAANRIAALRGNADLSENTLGFIQAGVTQGINSQLELLDAQTGVLNSRAGLLAAELDMSIAHATFDRLTGRYVRFANAAATPAAQHDPARK